MGFFNDISQNMHGERLERGFNDTLIQLDQLSTEERSQVLIDFTYNRNDLLYKKFLNMTSKGRLDLGTHLQKEAKKKYDYDIAGSCTLWLTGAWLESIVRSDYPAALEVQRKLNILANKMQKVIDQM